MEALQARGRYSQARQVSVLAGLPVHRLLLSQVRSTSTRTPHPTVLMVYWLQESLKLNQTRTGSGLNLHWVWTGSELSLDWV